MQKYSELRYSFKYPERGASLGLQTSASYELQLMEVAVRGGKVFENTWNERATIDEQVMFLEILQEIQLWEKAECNALLVERARNLVVRMKDNKSFHRRALVVYRDILCSRHSPKGTDCSLSGRKAWIMDTHGSLSPDRNKVRRSKEAFTLDEKFDQAMSIEFPVTDDDESSTSSLNCSRTVSGEPSQTSCELISKYNDVSGESLSIFKKPPVIDVITTFEFSPGELSEFDSSVENYEDEDLAIYLENINIRYTQLCLGDGSLPPLILRQSIEQKESKEYSDREIADEKTDLQDGKSPQLLGSPGKDLKCLIWWTVDRVTYRAKSIDDLRSSHNVLIEGTFKKRCRSRRWRSYYGIVLDSGIMIYFRNGVFKKVADFRNCTHLSLKAEQFRLKIENLRLGSRVTNWILKFSCKKTCKTWHEIVVKISRNEKTEVSGLNDALLASEYI